MDDELRELISMVFNQEETAKFLARKLYRYFVYRDITSEIETEVISPLAIALIKSDFELEETVKILLRSNHFYDQDERFGNEILGGIIKSPLELTLQTINYFNIEIPNPIDDPNRHYRLFYTRTMLDTIFEFSGHPVFKPATVAGFPAYYQEPDYDLNWFNPSTIIARYKIGAIFKTGTRVLNGGTNGDVKVDMVEFVENHPKINPEEPKSIVTNLFKDLFAKKPKADRLAYYKDEILNDGLSDLNWKFEWQNYVATQDDSSIRPQLNLLFETIIFSQEFQCN